MGSLCCTVRVGSGKNITCLFIVGVGEYNLFALVLATK